MSEPRENGNTENVAADGVYHSMLTFLRRRKLEEQSNLTTSCPMQVMRLRRLVGALSKAGERRTIRTTYGYGSKVLGRYYVVEDRSPPPRIANQVDYWRQGDDWIETSSRIEPPLDHNQRRRTCQ